MKFIFILNLSLIFAFGLLRAQNLFDPDYSKQNYTAPDASSSNFNTPNSKYKLKPQDLLRVNIFQEPDLNKEVRVEADGTIVLSLIGKVKVGGLSTSEAQLVIQAMYNKDYLVNPQVSLLIVEYYPQRVQVLGQVNAPGFVIIPPEEKMTLTKAIAGASGFNQLADRRTVKIRRKLEGGEIRVTEVNVKEILDNPNASDPELFDGDVLMIEESVF